MRTLDRNKKPIYYSLDLGRTEILDENGFKTGEFTREFSVPTLYYISMSVETGNTSLEEYGQAKTSTLSLITCDMDCPMDEHTRLWIDTTPDESGYNYIIIGKFKGLDSVKYTAKKVDR